MLNNLVRVSVSFKVREFFCFKIFVRERERERVISHSVNEHFEVDQ